MPETLDVPLSSFAHIENGCVKQRRLHEELLASGLCPGFVGLRTSSAWDHIKLIFEEGSTIPDLEDLASVFSAHPSLAGKVCEENPALIMSMYEGPKIPYYLIDYITGLSVDGTQTRLHPEREIVKGELVRCVWYLEAPEDESGDPVPVENRTPILEYQATYTRFPDLRPRYRVSKRRWALQDGSWGPWHEKPAKFYIGHARAVELNRRATNCLSAQKALGMAALMEHKVNTEGKTEEQAASESLVHADEWFTTFSPEVGKFKETNGRAYFDAIKASEGTIPWADSTPGFREAVEAEVNLGGWT